MKIIAVIVMQYVNVLLFMLGVLFVMPLQAKTISQNGSLALTPSHGSGSAWGKSNCNACHIAVNLHKSVPKIKQMVDKKKSLLTCSGCHGDNGVKNVQKQCLICHNITDMPKNPLRSGSHRHDFDASKDLPTTNKQCIICHEASNMNGKFEPTLDLTRFEGATYENSNEFCLVCHNRTHQQAKFPIIHAGKRDQSIAAEDDYRKIDKHGMTDGEGTGLYKGLRGGYAYKTIVDCVDCHTMHGTINTGLIIDDSRKGAFLLEASLRNKPYRIKLVENDTNYSQLCALCHNMETVAQGGDIDTGNGLRGVHFNNGSDCVTCHNHGERVQKGL
jgi:hypothetical protein